MQPIERKSRPAWRRLGWALGFIVMVIGLGSWSLITGLTPGGWRLEFGRSRFSMPCFPELAPELIADGLTIVEFRREGHSQSFEGLAWLVRRRVILQLTRDGQPLDPEGIRYTLVDMRGQALSSGPVRLRVTEGQTGEFEVVDPQIDQAVRIVLHRK